MAERAAEMGQALIDHLQRILASNQCKQQQQQQQQQQAEDVAGLTLKTVLGNVWVLRCLNDAELMQTLQHLPAFLDSEPEVREGGKEGRREERREGRRGQQVSHAHPHSPSLPPPFPS